MKLPHTSSRPEQINIKPAIIQVRTLLYMRTTQHSIRNVHDILWAFPERAGEKRNSDTRWKWLMVKRTITNFMNSSKMQKEWYLSSPVHHGATKQWTRIKKTTIEPNTVVQYYSSTVLQYTRAERERERVEEVIG